MMENNQITINPETLDHLEKLEGMEVYPLFASLIKSIKNKHTMNEWMASIPHSVLKYCDHEFMKEKNSRIDEDLLATVPMMQFHINGKGINENEIQERVGNIQFILSLESIRRMGVVTISKIKKYSFMPSAKISAVEGIKVENEGNDMRVTGITLSKEAEEYLKYRSEKKHDGK